MSTTPRIDLLKQLTGASRVVLFDYSDRLGASVEVLDLNGVGLVFPVGGTLASGGIGVDVRPCL